MTRNKISGLLSEPVEEQDELMIKFAKFFYNKCIDKGVLSDVKEI